MTELIWDGKYDESGRRVSAPRIALPFQTVETINESAADRDRNFDVFASGRDTEWRNRLIWGDKKYVLPSLLEEFAGKVNLIYIDPPFDTGANFSFTATIPPDPNGQAEDVDFEKMPSMLEQKAYRDTWGLGRDSYLKWFSSTVELLRELLADDGSIFVHLDWHVGHYAKAVLDDVFGTDNFRNEIVWWYYNKMQGNVNHFPRNHDTIFYYVKSSKFKFERLSEPRPEPIRQQRRKWDSESGTLKQARDESGELEYYTVTDRLLDDVWRLHYLMPADRKENLGYRTQKPEALLERIVKAASKEGDLVLDCFCGSGTTAAVAEKMNRRWIACDLGRFAIHTTRKRLLGVPNVKPFDVENLGKYERQAWQVAEFGEGGEAQLRAYRRFILDLYAAQPVDGFVWLHGSKRGRMIHVGSIDAPVTMADVTSIATEMRHAIGRGTDAPKRSGVDILGWDFGFELNETARQQAALAGIDLRLVRIPREVLEKKAVDQGDIRFFELAALSVKTKKKGRTVTLELADFVIPLDDVPEDVQSQITHWEQWVDYWAVDWDNSGDAFHNEWQAYRTRKEPALDKKALHTYPTAGSYRVLVKVIDLLGNDTTKAIQVEVK